MDQKKHNLDIEINGVIYEIKPLKLLEKLKIIQIKLQTLGEYCKINDLKWGIITEKTYDTNFVNRKYR